MSAPTQCLLLLSHLLVAQSFHLPWNLVASRTPKYQDQTSWSQNSLSFSDNWDFPDNRDPDYENYISDETIANGLTKSEWLMPPSRKEKFVENSDALAESEAENIQLIKSSLQHVFQEIIELWNEMPSNVVDRVKSISKVIMVDALNAISSSYSGNNNTKTSEYFIFKKKYFCYYHF